MCERYSWVEKDGAILFLTTNDVYTTERGKDLQNYTVDRDFFGHGAIRWFYNNLQGGINKECTNFSSPANFPPELAQAIKDNQMAAFGVSFAMNELLTKSAWAKYKKAVAAATAKYNKTLLFAGRDKAGFYKVEQAAWAKVRKVESVVFWNLFEDPKNRAKAWR